MAINVLRYPYEAITDKTDYLQITIKQYNPARTGLIRSGSPNATAINVGNPSTLYSQTLAQDGVILLPMPSNIQDSNSVSYSDDSLDSITAKIADASGTLMKTEYKDDVSQFLVDTGTNALVGLKGVMTTPKLK